jgi:hypothetical protein
VSGSGSGSLVRAGVDAESQTESESVHAFLWENGNASLHSPGRAVENANENGNRACVPGRAAASANTSHPRARAESESEKRAYAVSPATDCVACLAVSRHRRLVRHVCRGRRVDVCPLSSKGRVYTFELCP